MAEQIIAESLLKKAVNFLFKGLGDILKEAEAIQKEGKPGVKLTLHSEIDTDEYSDIYAYLYSVKGKPKYYCDQIDAFHHNSDKKIKPSVKLKPETIDSSDEAVFNFIQKYVKDNGDVLGTLLSDSEWRDVEKGSTEKDESDTENVDVEDTAETEQDESSEDIDTSTIVNSRKLKMTLSPIEGSTDLSVSNIWANYSMINASDDIFALVGSPDVAALVNAEPVTIEVTQTDDDYDVEVVDTITDASQPFINAYQLAFSSMMQLYLAASIKTWTASSDNENCHYSQVVTALSDVLKTIALKMTHLNLNLEMQDADSKEVCCITPENMIEKAKDILYLLAEDLDDPTIFDREIDNLGRVVFY